MTDAASTTQQTSRHPGPGNAATGGAAGAGQDRAEEVTEAALDDLKQMRRVGMEMVAGLGRRVSGTMLPHDIAAGLDRGDPMINFIRLSRMVCRIIDMELAMVGGRAPAAPKGSSSRPGDATGIGIPSGREDIGRDRTDRANPAPTRAESAAATVPNKGKAKPSEITPPGIFAAATAAPAPSARAALLGGMARTLPGAAADTSAWRLPPSLSPNPPDGGHGPPR